MLSKTKDTLFVALATLVVNALLFLSIPLLSKMMDRERTMEYSGRPTVVSSHQEERRQEQDSPEPEESLTDEEPRTLPQEPLRLDRQPETRPEMNLDIRKPDIRLRQLEIGSLEIDPPEQELQSASQPRIPSPGDVYTLGQVDRRPRLVSKVNPVYPYRARHQNITGRLVLKFLVTRQGEVRKVSVIEADPEGVFEDKAIEAVKKWRFEPGTVKGKPVNTWVTVPITFQLSE